ncbi:hypothetical protein I4F81_011251 [Pyropia yezoensis]|uniref:Uncharacterized protein n=1 Tax=Pyropia yezoensis TaxID=2788 RepID=A0ACC3CFX6_PYRYE|nr:hypothetical protein I4F81_011251 [Neopyropia yezoensis]
MRLTHPATAAAFAAAPGALPPRTRPVRRCAATVAAGGTASPALTVAPSVIAPGRAALVASSAVGGAGRTALLQLPLSLLWTPETAAAALPPLPASPLLDDYALLSLALIHARAHPGAVDPVAAAYVAGLPDAAALDVPLLWADAELDRLAGSALGGAAARMKAEVAAEWAALDAEVLAPARDAFPADVYTADAYAWSAAVVVERGLSLPDYPLVLQLTAPASGVPVGAIVAGVTAAAASEGRSFRDYFLEAGAVVAAAPATDADGGGVVGLSFGLSPEDSQYDDKLDILETYAYPGESADGDEDEDGETAALRACVAYFTRERATLDSLEYYQERRLRELNLLRPVDPSEIVDSESGGRAAAAFDEYY